MAGMLAALRLAGQSQDEAKLGCSAEVASGEVGAHVE